MRIHFEQLRLATMLEHKTMETQLRGLYKILNKLKEAKINQYGDDNDKLLIPEM